MLSVCFIVSFAQTEGGEEKMMMKLSTQKSVTFSIKIQE